MEQTQGDVEIRIRNERSTSLPNPPYTPEDAESMVDWIYQHVGERSAGGQPLEEEPLLDDASPGEPQFVIQPEHLAEFDWGGSQDAEQ